MTRENDLITLVDRLSRFFFLAQRYGGALHHKHNISSGERALLLELAAMGPRTVPQMADKRGISRQAIQKTVDALSGRGFVRKVVVPEDRRNRLLKLTSKGWDLIGVMKLAEKKEAQRLTDAVSTDKIEALNAFLDQIEAAMRQRAVELTGNRNAEP